jgi:hypothetical protein
MKILLAAVRFDAAMLLWITWALGCFSEVKE